MNNKILGIGLALLSASLWVAQAQEPPGCKTIKSKSHLATSEQQSEISGKLPRHKVLDLRRKKKKRVVQTESDAQAIPVIASPIYLPQTNSAGTAITASNGYLYVVVGQKLYKVSEKTLRTIEVSQLGHASIEQTLDTATPKKRRKIVASNADEPPTVRRPAKKHRSSKTD